ncbi:1886_t:CDS:1, partial [Scutellospora calospora]
GHFAAKISYKLLTYSVITYIWDSADSAYVWDFGKCSKTAEMPIFAETSLGPL